MFNALHQNLCHHEHEHAHIKGKMKHKGSWMNTSAYAQAYTACFARKIARVLSQEVSRRESPLLVEEMILGLEDHEKPEMAPEALRMQKRMRVSGKQPESSWYGKMPTWEEIFRNVGRRTPRVGNAYFEEDEMITGLVQKLVPEMRVKLMIACRGTDRHRTLDSSKGSFPFRKTMLVDRNSGEIRETGPVENWHSLPRLKQIRSTGPAKIALTIFGEQSQQCPDISSSCPMDRRENPETMNSVGGSSGHGDDVVSEGWAPKAIPTSGPQFERLESEIQSDVRRLHNNLGHPDPERFAKFLKERGAKEEVVDGARDYQCDSCVESQKQPRLSQPGRIHDNLDFNDVVGCDGAYWTSSRGQKFHFMHFIDEATLYHVGVASGREFPEQVRAFETAWTQ